MLCLTTLSTAQIEKRRIVITSVKLIIKVVEGSACCLVTDILISLDYTGYSRFAGRNLKPNLSRPTAEPWTFRTRTAKHSTANSTVVLPLGVAGMEWTEYPNCGTIVK